MIIQQIAFIIISGIAIFLFSKKVMEIRRNILLGKDEDLTDQPNQRWKNVMMNALGQKKDVFQPIRGCPSSFCLCGFYYYKH